MLYNVPELNKITKMPYEKDFNIWRNRLTDDEFNAIIDELNSRVEGDQVITSSWLPGADWTGTVFQPIYENAAFLMKKSQGNALVCFSGM